MTPARLAIGIECTLRPSVRGLSPRCCCRRRVLTPVLFAAPCSACGSYDSSSVCILERGRVYDASLQLYSRDGHLIYWETVRSFCAG